MKQGNFEYLRISVNHAMNVVLSANADGSDHLLELHALIERVCHAVRHEFFGLERGEVDELLTRYAWSLHRSLCAIDFAAPFEERSMLHASEYMMRTIQSLGEQHGVLLRERWLTRLRTPCDQGLE